MTAKIIDGKRIADEILSELAERVARLRESRRITPGLAAVLVGDDPGSQIYVRNKTRTCRDIGMVAETINMPQTAGQREIVETVEGLNRVQGLSAPEELVDTVHPLVGHNDGAIRRIRDHYVQFRVHRAYRQV